MPLTTVAGASPGCSVSWQVQSSFGLIGEGHEWWYDILGTVVRVCEVLRHPWPSQSNTCFFSKKRRKKPKGKSIRVVRTWELLNWVLMSLDSSGSVTDSDRWAHCVWECGTLGVCVLLCFIICHMNKTLHTLTVIAIMIELSRRGAGSWYTKCGGWDKNIMSSE